MTALLITISLLLAAATVWLAVRASQSQAREAALTARLKLAEELLAQERQRAEAERQRAAADEERFATLAKAALADQSQAMQRQQAQSLAATLQPLKENIDKFRERIDACYSAEGRERFALAAQIKELVEANRLTADTAGRLTRALRGDTRAQGSWGENVLERILETSGLRPGEDFVRQATTGADGRTLTGDDGRSRRPDVVVYLPGGRALAIDSKVSLTAYLEYVDESAGDDARSAALDRHVASVRAKVRELGGKGYEAVLAAHGAAVDFTLMFIPNEGAFMAAMHAAPGLWQEAYDQKVVIVSPVHLVSTLSLAAQMWTQERRNDNALAIADRAGKLYDKFHGLVTDIDASLRAVRAAGDAIERARGKLYEGRGNLIGRVEQLKAMGARATKSLPATEQGEQ